ncbi:MAG TPA: hypothetical protein PKB02_00610 [Anaerohalosphaeraceae bacterium]|nr:hypothetical protein [Anaerohalosphaeraceae bacterium]
MHKIRWFTQTVLLVLTLTFPFLGGCSPVKLSRTPHKNAEHWTTFDPNDYDIHVETDNKGVTSYHWNRDYRCNDTVVLPYWEWKQIFLGVPIVKGQLNGTDYPVIFDTGCSPIILISDVHINKHQLPVLFFSPNDKPNSPGLAIVENLTIGSLRLENYPCCFSNYSADIRFLGLPAGLTEAIIMPLEIMSAFRYVQYDQINQELSFSNTQSFMMKDSSEWMTFPFEITGEDIQRIILTIPIEGISTRLFLDTGGASQLELDNDIIEQLFEKRPELCQTRKGKTKTITPYGSGEKASLKMAVKNLQFGDTVVKKLTILYDKIPSDKQNPIFQGTIGIDLFRNTIMVLDFENKVMRVKKTKKCLFES